MDIKIENKDILLKHSGHPVMVSSTKQVIQQVKIALGLKRGSFIYDRKMGIELDRAMLEKENAVETLQTLIRESLIDDSKADVEVQYIENREEKIYAGIVVTDGYRQEKTEVIVFE